MNELTINVGGMTCNHCKKTVETNLKKINGIKDIQIDLPTGNVNIQGDNLNTEEIQETITGLGYTFNNL